MLGLAIFPTTKFLRLHFCLIQQKNSSDVIRKVPTITPPCPSPGDISISIHRPILCDPRVQANDLSAVLSVSYLGLGLNGFIHNNCSA